MEKVPDIVGRYLESAAARPDALVWRSRARFKPWIVCAGVWVMRVKNPDAARPFKTPLVPFVPIMGILWNFAMMYALGWSNWLRLFIWLAIGQVIYFTYSRHHSRLREPARVAVRKR